MSEAASQARVPVTAASASALYARNARALLAMGFLLVLIAGASSVLLFLRAADANNLITHTLDVRQGTTDLLTNLQDAETGQRGFLLTGVPSYLAPYSGARPAMEAMFADLVALTSDNPAQQQRLNDLKPKIDAKFDELGETVTLFQQGQREQAIALVNTNRGKELMDQIRAGLTAISEAEYALLGTRQTDADGLRRAVLVLIIFTLAGATILALILARSAQYYLARLGERTVELERESRRRQEAEDTLRQAQKLEAIGQLTGGIAHDFNNLLTIIGGNLDTMQRRLASATAQGGNDLAVVLARPLEFALHGTKSAAQLTHRLLAFSRRQPLAPTRADLNRLISGMSDLLRRTLGETINIETALAGGLWPAIADVNQLENALINLAINARDAMPNGGRLTIETANIYLDEGYAARFGDVKAGQYVLLSVTDTGAGIAPELLEKVFEPFFTTKIRGEGTGLGLAMVHGFVKQSGGHVRIYSETGLGTSVKIYLPRHFETEALRTAPAAKPVADEPVARAAPQETLLVVEDNDGVRDYAKAVLEELGYRVLVAGTAAAALRVFEAAPRIDLLFTDVVLPDGANGRELANQILEQRADLPVLFTTGYTRNAIVHGGRLDANVHLLSKPYTQQDLARKIRDLLDAKARGGTA